MKICNYLKNKAEENKSEEFTLKINIQETKNYFVEKIEQSKLRSKKTQKDLHDAKLYWAISRFSFCSY